MGWRSWWGWDFLGWLVVGGRLGWNRIGLDWVDGYIFACVMSGRKSRLFFGLVGFAYWVFVSLINTTIGVYGVEVGFWYSRCDERRDRDRKSVV